MALAEKNSEVTALSAQVREARAHASLLETRLEQASQQLTAQRREADDRGRHAEADAAAAAAALVALRSEAEGEALRAAEILAQAEALVVRGTSSSSVEGGELAAAKARRGLASMCSDQLPSM